MTKATIPEGSLFYSDPKSLFSSLWPKAPSTPKSLKALTACGSKRRRSPEPTNPPNPPPPPTPRAMQHNHEFIVPALSQCARQQLGRILGTLFGHALVATVTWPRLPGYSFGGLCGSG